jgi:pimeloyl-ACP methyl ester carboxylesterase
MFTRLSSYTSGGGQDVFLLLEKLEVSQFSAMGMSSGATTLLHMATSHPLRIDSMVLISATTHIAMRTSEQANRSELSGRRLSLIRNDQAHLLAALLQAPSSRPGRRGAVPGRAT